jgi:2-polyprenyl-3-methyl-5-hydroxy-6-metoxy-1,4-benzoquinol methylase
MFKCIACNYEINAVLINDYIQCPKCKSYNYISSTTAEEDNKSYFNSFLQRINNFKESPVKKSIYRKLEAVDIRKRRNDYNQFHQSREFIKKLLENSPKVLEVGFGQGDMLITLLKKGIDAYGIDISETAVRNFMEKYPEFKDKVQCGSSFNQSVDLVYSCALFEHLDSPDQFISNIFTNLSENGVLILDGLPILTKNESLLNKGNDICFWKPCHRIIYSDEGLIALLTKFNFNCLTLNFYDVYLYRILSCHIQKNYKKIIEYRNPFLSDKELPGVFNFYCICRKAIKMKSLALYGCAVFKKET